MATTQINNLMEPNLEDTLSLQLRRLLTSLLPLRSIREGLLDSKSPEMGLQVAGKRELALLNLLKVKFDLIRMGSLEAEALLSQTTT